MCEKKKKKKKREKKNVGAEIWNGLLPNCIAKRKGFVLQYKQCIASWKGLSRLDISVL